MYLDFHTHFSNSLDFENKFQIPEEETFSVFNWIMNENGSINDLKRLIELYPVQKFSIGIHPWHIISSELADQLTEIEELLKSPFYSPSLIMIGECGLDKHIEIDLSLQKRVFLAQLELAEKFNKPVVLHVVKAFDEIISLSRPFLNKIPLTIHGFNKSTALATQLWAGGFGLSFGKPKNSDYSKGDFLKLKFKNELFFFETDSSPDSIKNIYDSYSFLTGNSVNTLKDSNFANWKKIGII